MNKNITKLATFICILMLIAIFPALAINIDVPDTNFSNNNTLTVKLNNATNVEDYNYAVKKDGNVRLSEAGFSSDGNGNLVNNSHDISDVSSGAEINVTVNAFNKTSDSKISNSSRFTVDREGPEYVLDSPVNNKNTSELLEVNVTDNDLSDLTTSYNLTSSYNSFESYKELNLTKKLDTSGEYILNLNITDEAGNNEEKQINFTYDNVTPSYDGNVPSYFNESLKIDKSFSNVASGVKESSYSIQKDGSVVDDLESLQFGTKQTSLESLLTHKENYTINLSIEDFAGNKFSKEYSSKVDFEAPERELTSPENLTMNVSGDQLFKVGFDTTNKELLESGISQDSYFELPNSTVYVSTSQGTILSIFDQPAEDTDPFFTTEALEGKYGTTALDDGVYEFVLGLVDKAGNVDHTRYELHVSNNPPNISSVEYEGEELTNGSILSDGAVSVDTVSEGVGLSSLTYSWDSQETKDIEDGSFEINVSDGTYTLEIVAEDGVGNTATKTIQNVVVETTSPTVELTRETSEGWRKSHNTTVSCNDGGSGVDASAVFLGDDQIEDWADGGESSFDISEHGQNEFEFRCRDKAGNIGAKSIELKVDSKHPSVHKFNPSSGEKSVNTSRVFEAEVSNNTILSGLDVGQSSIDVSNGQIGDLQASNGVVSADLSDLPFSTEISVNGTLVDKVGNEADFETSFETMQEPAEWITIADSIQASESMALGVMRREVGEDVGDISISIEDSDSIREFDLRRSEGGEASVTIVEEDDAPEEFDSPEGGVYRYAGIETEGIESGQILSSNITFEVNSTWVESNGGQGSLSIIRNQGDGWEEMNGTVESRDESVFVSAEVSDFSWFAVKSDSPASSGGFVSRISSVSIPSISLAFGLADLMTAGLLAVISILLLYLLELMEVVKLPRSITSKIERIEKFT